LQKEEFLSIKSGGVLRILCFERVKHSVKYLSRATQFSGGKSFLSRWWRNAWLINSQEAYFQWEDLQYRNKKLSIKKH